MHLSIVCSASLHWGGKVHWLHSNQGNFTGADRELAKLMEKCEKGKLKNFLISHGSKFIQHVPQSSYMDGIWERQIWSIQSNFTGLLCNATGRFDSSSLWSFFCEIMAIVNSRTLSRENLNDPLGRIPTTPNHLLTPKTEPVIPPSGEFVCEDLYTRKRWKKVQYLSERFWQQ